MNNNDFRITSTNTVNWKGVKYSRSSTTYWLQSFCHVSTDNSIVAFYHGDSGSFVEKINLSTYQMTAYSLNYNYSHANDCTYNPTTQKIYLVPMYDEASGNDRNLVFVLNKNTFAKESEIHIGNDTSNSVYGIAYDSVNNIYYAAMSGSTIAKLDSNFNIISTFSFNSYSLPTTVFQNLEVYNEKLFLVYNDSIHIFDIDANMIKFISMDSAAETEGFASIGGGNFLVGKVYKTEPTIIYNSINLFNIFDSGLNNPFLTLTVKAKTKNGSSIVDNVNYVKKRDRTVYCNICLSGLTSLDDVIIAELPSGFRPSNYVRFIGARAGHNWVRFEISTSGEIRARASSSSTIQSSNWVQLVTTFITD